MSAVPPPTPPSRKSPLAGPDNPHVGDFRKHTARAWARGAHLDLDESAAAWMLCSEADPDEVFRYPQYGRELVRACRRESLATGRSIHDVVTAEDRKVPGAGHYGKQAAKGYCASTQWPLVGHLAMVREVLAEPMDLKDAQTGARRWMHARTQDRLFVKGKTDFDAMEILRRRWGHGFCWVGPQYDRDHELLIDPYLLWLGRPRRASDRLEHGLSIIEDGRKRYRITVPPPPPKKPPPKVA